MHPTTQEIAEAYTTPYATLRAQRETASTKYLAYLDTQDQSPPNTAVPERSLLDTYRTACVLCHVRAIAEGLYDHAVRDGRTTATSSIYSTASSYACRRRARDLGITWPDQSPIAT